MLRCRLRFIQRLICLIIIVIGAALILVYRYHELAVLNNSDFLQRIISKDKETDEKPTGSPMVVYKRKLNPLSNSNKTKTLSVTDAWDVWRSWPHSTQLYTEQQFNSNEMRDILYHMVTAPIVRFDVGHKGTQLKALIELEGGQRAVFKPKRYL